MGQRLRLGVIGCGVIGSCHVATAATFEFIEITAVADLDVGRATALATQYNIPKAYGAAADLIDDPLVDAVVVALPAGVRHPIALAVLQAHKHLLIEKPAGMNAPQIRELIACQGNVVAASCSSRMRHSVPSTVAADALRTDAIGELRVIRIRGVLPAPVVPDKLPPSWRLSRELNGGGVIANWGTYDFDYILGLLDWTVLPRSVFAMTWPHANAVTNRLPAGSDAETHAIALVQCDDDIALTIERGEYLPQPKHVAWEIVGTTGSLQLCMVPSADSRIVISRIDESGVTSETLWQGEFSLNDGHIGVLSNFAHAILLQRTPATTLENALVIQDIIDAIYRSASTKSAVCINVEA